MALDFKQSLALTQILDSSQGETLAQNNTLAEEGHGAATAEEKARYDDKTSSGVEYNKNYPIYDVFEDTELTTINANKKMSLNASQLNLTQERNSQYVPFSMPRYCDGYDLANGIIWIITDAGEKKEPYAIQPVNVYVRDNKIYFAWLIDGYITRQAGTVTFEIHVHGQVQGVRDGQEVISGYVWKTQPGTLTVNASKFNIDQIISDNLSVKNENWLDDIIVNVVGTISQDNLREAIDAKDAAVVAQLAAEQAKADMEEALRQFEEETLVTAYDEVLAIAEHEALRAEIGRAHV